FGKSTLAAACLRAGHRLLTDDLLVVKERPADVIAFPGPPRLKLFPEAAAEFLGTTAGTPMNGQTAKLVIPLGPDRTVSSARPLSALYVLRPPSAQERLRRVGIRRLSPRQALLALIGSTFNTRVRDAARLARQFAAASRVATRVPVKVLSYPRDLACLPAAVEAVQADLARSSPRDSRLPS